MRKTGDGAAAAQPYMAKRWLDALQAPSPTRAPPHAPPRAAQVKGCPVDLSLCKAYYRRFRICERHLKTLSLCIEGKASRFCQQCGRFHVIEEFEGNKRSCRRALLTRFYKRRNMSVPPEVLPPPPPDSVLQAGARDTDPKPRSKVRSPPEPDPSQPPQRRKRGRPRAAPMDVQDLASGDVPELEAGGGLHLLGAQPAVSPSRPFPTSAQQHPQLLLHLQGIKTEPEQVRPWGVCVLRRRFRLRAAGSGRGSCAGLQRRMGARASAAARTPRPRVSGPCRSGSTSSGVGGGSGSGGDPPSAHLRYGFNELGAQQPGQQPPGRLGEAGPGRAHGAGLGAGQVQVQQQQLLPLRGEGGLGAMEGRVPGAHGLLGDQLTHLHLQQQQQQQQQRHPAGGPARPPFSPLRPGNSPSPEHGDDLRARAPSRLQQPQLQPQQQRQQQNGHDSQSTPYGGGGGGMAPAWHLQQQRQVVEQGPGWGLAAGAADVTANGSLPPGGGVRAETLSRLQRHMLLLQQPGDAAAPTAAVFDLATAVSGGGLANGGGGGGLGGGGLCNGGGSGGLGGGGLGGSGGLGGGGGLGGSGGLGGDGGLGGGGSGGLAEQWQRAGGAWGHGHGGVGGGGNGILGGHMGCGSLSLAPTGGSVGVPAIGVQHGTADALELELLSIASESLMADQGAHAHLAYTGPASRPLGLDIGSAEPGALLCAAGLQLGAVGNGCGGGPAAQGLVSELRGMRMVSGGSGRDGGGGGSTSGSGGWGGEASGEGADGAACGGGQLAFGALAGGGHAATLLPHRHTSTASSGDASAAGLTLVQQLQLRALQQEQQHLQHHHQQHQQQHHVSGSAWQLGAAGALAGGSTAGPYGGGGIVEGPREGAGGGPGQLQLQFMQLQQQHQQRLQLQQQQEQEQQAQRMRQLQQLHQQQQRHFQQQQQQQPSLKDAALALLAQGGAHATYSPPASLLERLSIKIHKCRPEQLSPDLASQLTDWLITADASVVQGFVRPGCTHLVVDLLYGDRERLMQALFGAEGSDPRDAAATLARRVLGAPPDTGPTSDMHLQLGDSTGSLRSFTSGHTWGSTGAPFVPDVAAPAAGTPGDSPTAAAAAPHEAAPPASLTAAAPPPPPRPASGAHPGGAPRGRRLSPEASYAAAVAPPAGLVPAPRAAAAIAAALAAGEDVEAAAAAATAAEIAATAAAAARRARRGSRHRVPQYGDNSGGALVAANANAPLLEGPGATALLPLSDPGLRHRRLEPEVLAAAEAAYNASLAASAAAGETPSPAAGSPAARTQQQQHASPPAPAPAPAGSAVAGASELRLDSYAAEAAGTREAAAAVAVAVAAAAGEGGTRGAGAQGPIRRAEAVAVTLMREQHKQQEEGVSARREAAAVAAAVAVVQRLGGGEGAARVDARAALRRRQEQQEQQERSRLRLRQQQQQLGVRARALLVFFCSRCGPAAGGALGGWWLVLNFLLTADAAPAAPAAATGAAAAAPGAPATTADADAAQGAADASAAAAPPAAAKPAEGAAAAEPAAADAAAGAPVAEDARAAPNAPAAGGCSNPQLAFAALEEQVRAEGGGMGLLHHAVRSGCAETVALLLAASRRAGAPLDVARPGPYGVTAVHLAALLPYGGAAILDAIVDHAAATDGGGGDGGGAPAPWPSGPAAAAADADGAGAASGSGGGAAANSGDLGMGGGSGAPGALVAYEPRAAAGATSVLSQEQVEVGLGEEVEGVALARNAAADAEAEASSAEGPLDIGVAFGSIASWVDGSSPHRAPSPAPSSGGVAADAVPTLKGAALYGTAVAAPAGGGAAAGLGGRGASGGAAAYAAVAVAAAAVAALWRVGGWAPMLLALPLALLLAVLAGAVPWRRSCAGGGSLGAL
ncbi:Squamosa promoter-binding-like protein 3 [Tetrabaena socialis]|uniref:Squamosa promoter-binding-like protein 3 n=1 Tax=Tetrabaena socialis TaxID=47790 RepID=A0A2J7ZWE0_9CHLO|nr:Squamosa promoter-binding-like protein 3 [Tetrabaena socialis]|eukprot:PNH04574.1 Squamosa promoter-binding-like protein 3 [Tetrabaena socialis]